MSMNMYLGQGEDLHVNEYGFRSMGRICMLMNMYLGQWGGSVRENASGCGGHAEKRHDGELRTTCHLTTGSGGRKVPSAARTGKCTAQNMCRENWYMYSVK